MPRIAKTEQDQGSGNSRGRRGGDSKKSFAGGGGDGVPGPFSDYGERRLVRRRCDLARSRFLADGGRILLLGRSRLAIDYFDFVRASQRKDGNVPFAIFPEMKADNTCLRGLKWPDDVFSLHAAEAGRVAGVEPEDAEVDWIV